MKNEKYYKGFFKTKDPNVFGCGRVHQKNGSIYYMKTYTLGKEHRHNGPLIMCESGLHCCRYLVSVFKYYYIDHRLFNTAYCIVEPYGKRIVSYQGSVPYYEMSSAVTYMPGEKMERSDEIHKICCSRLKVARKLNNIDIINILISEMESRMPFSWFAFGYLHDIYKEVFRYTSRKKSIKRFRRCNKYTPDIMGRLHKALCCFEKTCLNAGLNIYSPDINFLKEIARKNG